MLFPTYFKSCEDQMEEVKLLYERQDSMLNIKLNMHWNNKNSKSRIMVISGEGREGLERHLKLHL